MVPISHSIFSSKITHPPTKKTCPKNDLLWGKEGLKNIRSISNHRIVAIRGLNLECAEAVYRELYSNDGIAMAAGLMEEDSHYATAQKNRTICHKIRGEE